MKTKELKSRSWGHQLAKLHNEAIVRGLAPEAADRINISNVMELLDLGNRKEAFRYFTRESQVMPEITWAGKEVNHLIDLVETRINYTRGAPSGAAKVNLVIGGRFQGRHP